MRTLAATATTLALAVGLDLVAAGPAAAATGRWVPYGNTNPITSSSSRWKCGPTLDVHGDDVLAQACAVRTADFTSVQAAVIVRNNQSTLYSVSADARMWRYLDDAPLGYWYCDSSGVAPHSWSVCFGKTFAQSRSVYTDEAKVNLVYLPASPPV